MRETQIVAQMNTASSPAVITSLQLTAWSAQVMNGMGGGGGGQGGSVTGNMKIILVPPLISPAPTFLKLQSQLGRLATVQATWVPFRVSILRTLPSVLWNLQASLSWIQLADRSWSCYLEDVPSHNRGGSASPGCVYGQSTTATCNRWRYGRAGARYREPSGKKSRVACRHGSGALTEQYL